MIKIIMEQIKLKSRSSIWRFYAFTFLMNLHFFSAVLVPFFTQWGGISKFQMQLLQSWFMLWIFLLEVPTGAIADFIGRKYSLVLSALVAVFASIVYGSVPQFEFFLFGEFLFAASIALLSGADNAFLYDTLKESGQEHKSKEIFGRAHSIMLLAMLISAPIGSMIASNFGLNMPMFLRAIPVLFAAGIAWTLKEPNMHTGPQERNRYIDIAKKGALFFLTHPILRLIAIDAIVVASAAYFVIWLYQPFLEMIHIQIKYFGLFHMTLMISEIIIASQFMRLEKFMGSGKKFIQFSALVTAVSFILVGIFPNIFTVLFLVIVGGGFGLTRLEYMTTYMNKLIPSTKRATVLSSISMFRRLALVFLNPIIGFIADRSLVLAAISVGILPILLFFFSPLEKEMLE